VATNREEDPRSLQEPRPGSDFDMDDRIEAAMRDLLADTVQGRTICPSEVARRVSRTDWRPLMEPTRAVARRLVANGEAEVLQRGAVVDPASVRGPIRIRRVPEAGPVR
jgi:hypothetical protein